MSHHKDEDNAEHVSIFQNLNKSALLNEVRIFNDPQIDSRKCTTLITKLLWVIGQGDKFTHNEATNIFFAVTKLFQCKDEKLRRMVYLIIKELTPSETEVIIVTSILTKDMTSTNDLFRANAIRVLCSITDAAMLAQIERHLKQAIVDKQSFVSSAALISGLHLMKKAPDVVRRWVSEVNQVATEKRGPMVQYHSLALLYAIKQNDRLAVSKLVQTLAKGPQKAALAQCLLIRYASSVMVDSTEEGRRPYFEFLENCLRHSGEMVICEAARAICEIPGVTVRELSPVITVLQLFLSSPKPTFRFAGVRALNKIAMLHPLPVTVCNLDLESMISDSNRSIATLAITTLLRTGSESGVDRLLRQIQTFMGEIADEFKVVVIDAMHTLCLKYPAKHRTLMIFLSNALREEGGFDFKRSIVDSMVSIIDQIPEAKDIGMMHLCEFIEDCEFTYLSTQILHLLANEGPKSATPSRYIRYIYNRVILENANVRAAAVCALSQFGVQVPALREQVMMLLSRCLDDPDDEVRDRASFNLSLLQQQDSAALAKYVTEVPNVGVDAVEKALLEYKAGGNFAAPFEYVKIVALQGQKEAMSKMSKAQSAEAKASAVSSDASSSSAAGGSGGVGGGVGGGKPAVQANVYKDMLATIPALAELGKLFKSSSVVELTESESEYRVACVKHIFPAHIVFQFTVTNTLEEYALGKVTVQMETSACEGIEYQFSVPAELVKQGEPALTFVAMAWDGENAPTGEIACTLNFTVHEVDSSSGEVDRNGYEDEYQLEAVSLTTADFVIHSAPAEFTKAWEEMASTGIEATSAFSLPNMKSLQHAVTSIIDITGLLACSKTGTVPASSKSHRLLLQGIFLGDHRALAILDLALGAPNTIEMKLAVRADSEEVSEKILSAMT